MSTESVRNPYAGAMRATVYAAGVSVIVVSLGLLAMTAGWRLGWIGFFGAPGFLFCLVLWPIFYFTGRAEVRQVEGLKAGGHLAHWTYSAEEWRRFTEDEWARDLKRSRRLPFTVFIGFLVIGIFLAWLNGNWSLGLAVGVACGAVTAPLVWATLYLIARSTHARRLAGPGEVLIGPGGVYQDGRFTSWSTYGLRLAGVQFIPATLAGVPPVLEFTIRGGRGGEGKVRVLVPAGKEKEAEGLVGNLATQ
ncbi:MAG TPA: hypothetical protein VFD85_14495 [Gemmatimonadales bacterium]|nr:hypothetical protein [Gemmatimonadales bacterium]HZH42219.1 hypothetical protein [Gemmatimonadales bacterium]